MDLHDAFVLSLVSILVLAYLVRRRNRQKYGRFREDLKRESRRAGVTRRWWKEPPDDGPEDDY